MRKELKEFMIAARKLSDAWNENMVKEYPDYLPSFDEFIEDFGANLLIREPFQHKFRTTESFEDGRTQYITPCPVKGYGMVGAKICRECNNHKGIDTFRGIVYCNGEIKD